MIFCDTIKICCLKKGLTKCTANGFGGSLFSDGISVFRYVVLRILLYLGSKGTIFSDLEFFAASAYIVFALIR
jgi:hypothetical protein